MTMGERMAHFFSTERGKRIRQRVLVRDMYLCQMCGTSTTTGRKASNSAVVDHVAPVALRPDLVDDMANLRCVCRRCHAACDSIEKRLSPDSDAIVAAKLAYRPVGLDGYPIG